MEENKAGGVLLWGKLIHLSCESFYIKNHCISNRDSRSSFILTGKSALFSHRGVDHSVGAPLKELEMLHEYKEKKD